MSNKSIVGTIVAVAIGFVAFLACPLPRQSREVVRKSRPVGARKRIRSYFARGTGPTLTAIPSVEGVNGFVVTDIMATAINVGHFRVTLVEDGGDTPQSKAQFLVQGDVGGTYPVSYHFESGLVLTPGRSFQASTNLSNEPWSITISGYSC